MLEWLPPRCPVRMNPALIIIPFHSFSHYFPRPPIEAYKITTKTRVFRHSAQEKKEYVKSFLKAISIQK